MPNFLYHLLPHRCPLCLSRSQSYLCSECRADLPRVATACRTCGLPLDSGFASCGDCLALPKAYTATVCPLLYRHPVDRLLAQFKNRQPRIVGAALLPLLTADLHLFYGPTNPWPQVLVPVPCHWRTRLRRGFNQAQALAELLQGETGIPVHPWVNRVGGVRHQKTLDRKTRFANLRHAFDCNRSLAGERIAVVDDVITTGATAALMSRCLLNAGAGEVHIWALARTPKPGL